MLLDSVPLGPLSHEPLLFSSLRRHPMPPLLVPLSKPREHLQHVGRLRQAVPQRPAADGLHELHSPEPLQRADRLVDSAVIEPGLPGAGHGGRGFASRFPLTTIMSLVTFFEPRSSLDESGVGVP